MLEKINSSIVEAMKNKDSFRLSNLRMLKGAIQLELINKRRDLTDEEISSIVMKQVKLRKDSIVEFEKGKREDLIDNTKEEIKILSEFLGNQFTLEELSEIIDRTIEDSNLNKQSDFGRLMGLIGPLVKGKADMTEVSRLLKDKLDF